MKNLETLMGQIIRRVNTNLRGFSIDTEPYLKNMVSIDQLAKFYGFYGIWSNNPICFQFNNSNLSGSYFLGRVHVDNSILYKCDIRGDELKHKGDTLEADGLTWEMEEDEKIWIKNSYLIKTLVHNFSHDIEKPELFLIKRSASAPYANIHGSPLEGCFLEPFSTVDLTTLKDCRVGAFTYLQMGELSHADIESGKIWVKNGDVFDFQYNFPREILNTRYIAFEPEKGAMGMFIDFAEDRKIDFQRLYESVYLESPIEDVPPGASINRYSVWKGRNLISKNVYVSQRAFLESSQLGEGANAQENCYIAYSTLEGYNVTAHGASIIYAHMEKKVFVGFNSFLWGKEDCKIHIGEECVVMPHTIIDPQEPIEIPARRLVWGLIRTQEDLKENTYSLDQLSRISGELKLGNMTFTGEGSEFVNSFRHRIEHILEANGAYFDGKNGVGHAQRGQDISFNIVQPYSESELKGMYPSIRIQP